jgi:hypothetical protein
MKGKANAEIWKAESREENLTAETPSKKDNETTGQRDKKD